ncbi:MAG: RNA polymerase sigma factor [Acidimicrobiales bacterium]
MWNLGTAEGSSPVEPSTLRPDDFAAWVSPHIAAMSRLASRLAGAAERDDVVQEALTGAWRRRETFRPERGTPQAWLLAIVADRARRHRYERPVAIPPADPTVEVQERDLDLEQAIHDLPRRQRLAVELHYFVGLTTAEAAEVLACSEGTVKSNLHDARARLRRSLERP